MTISFVDNDNNNGTSFTRMDQSANFYHTKDGVIDTLVCKSLKHGFLTLQSVSFRSVGVEFISGPNQVTKMS